jgi:hypothetical protein
MSKPSARKKARRQKRHARRAEWASLSALMNDPEQGVRLAPRNVTDALLGVDNSLEDSDYPAEVVELVRQAQRFEHRIMHRGWTFDAEHSKESFVSWYFTPSGTEFEDDTLEPVTRVWLTVFWDDLTDPNDFPDCVNVLFVGSSERDISQRPTPDRFFDQIDAIEAYRPGDPVPALVSRGRVGCRRLDTSARSRVCRRGIGR